MKIDNSLPPIGNTTANPATREPKPPAAAAPSTGANTERIDISSLSAQLQKAGEAPFDSARVDGLRQAIAEGRFQINPERIADRLIDGIRELLTSRR